ncbi:hypothetical protein HGRIS_012443 [Hohenbuehelia grisea]|uniref:Lysine-specific metallo-endopeptidase domain-containing protein n=1 Tax=Hohenbuehelia grisea TaxID=104357 RepID=A0ABR3ISG5_9AGAR
MTFAVLCVLVTVFGSIANAAPFPLTKRAIGYKVLQAGPGVTDGCSPKQIEQLTDMIADTKKLAQSAQQTLALPNVEKSSGFTALFGPTAKASAISTGHYAPVISSLQVPTPITSLAGVTENDLTFTCPPATDPKAATAYASTRNFSGGGSAKGGKDNLIRFQQLAFKGAESFTVAAGEFKKTGSFKNVPLAFTMIHEAQHAIPIVGAANRCIDVKVGGKPMYGLQQIQHKITDAEKLQNAQNYAWFALLTVSNPEYFTDDCGGKASSIPPPQDQPSEGESSKTPAKPPSRPSSPKKEAGKRREITGKKPKNGPSKAPAAKPPVVAKPRTPVVTKPKPQPQSPQPAKPPTAPTRGTSKKVCQVIKGDFTGFSDVDEGR